MLHVYASLPEDVARQLTLDRDPHGNRTGIFLIETGKATAEMVATKLKEWKKEGSTMVSLPYRDTLATKGAVLHLLTLMPTTAIA